MAADVKAEYTLVRVAGAIAGDTDGVGSSARFKLPHGCAFAPANADPTLRGQLIVADSGNDLLRAVSADGVVKTVVCGHMPTLPGVQCVAFHPDGPLFVGTRSALWRVADVNAQPELIAGHATEKGRVDGDFKCARFHDLLGLLCTADGKLIYAADHTFACD